MSYKTKHLIRYVCVGLLAYLVEITALLILNKSLGWSAELATAAAFWVGLLSAFWLQKIFTYRDYTKTRRAIAKQMLGYGLLVAFNYTFTLLVVTAFPDNMLLVSRTLALAITTVWNFFIYKIIFSSNPKKALMAYQKSLKKAPVRLKKFVIYHKRTIIFGLLASLPIIIFFYQYLATAQRIIPGDFDYYLQMNEAARTTILKYHQFPSWNPWMSGGVPLFANPQFGGLSLQLLLSLIFGTILGLKLAYIAYALSGFWGMYLLCKSVFKASRIRSLSLGYIWVFCGFFAGHNISHFTFTSFFLLPWLIYFIAQRRRRYSWLGLGITESVIILSSLHYAFLMTVLAMGIFFGLSVLVNHLVHKDRTNLKLLLKKSDLLFALKASLVILLLSGYRLLTTYYFVKNNEKSAVLLHEPANSLSVIFKAIFYPIGTIMKTYPKTTWGWGEYSMYFGFATGIALLVLIATLLITVIRRKTLKNLIASPTVIVCILLVGLLGVVLAVGDFGPTSPFHLLQKLPGFAQTRVPARWVLFTMFSLLMVLAAWKRTPKLINLLLLISVVELFISYGPPKINGKNEVYIPKGEFANTFTQYDNGREHMLDPNDTDLYHSYLFTTYRNIGQVYADDSLVDTLHGTLPTTRCGENKNPSCHLVLTTNANVTNWSPNKITINRTAGGPIELNMNVEAGWRINDKYPYAFYKKIDPTMKFVLPANEQFYTLEYAPKFSPSWFIWKIDSLFN